MFMYTQVLIVAESLLFQVFRLLIFLIELCDVPISCRINPSAQGGVRVPSARIQIEVHSRICFNNYFVVYVHH